MSSSILNSSFRRSEGRAASCAILRVRRIGGGNTDEQNLKKTRGVASVRRVVARSADLPRCLVARARGGDLQGSGEGEDVLGSAGGDGVPLHRPLPRRSRDRGRRTSARFPLLLLRRHWRGRPGEDWPPGGPGGGFG